MNIDLDAALREHFAFTGFRGRQREVIEHVLAGGDALVVMATGDGKSLCYQLPAMVSAGVTLVVSPLIALMEDQVQALRRRGLPATCIHSMIPAGERRQRLAAVQRGEVRLLYVTPERFRAGGFVEQIKNLPIPLLAIDEAHCVSHWGHDFRPDYGRLGEVRAALGSPPCLALTATATPDVQRDIRAVLKLEDAKLFHTGIARPNLYLGVHDIQHQEQKLERILEVIERVGGPGIVYTALIRDLLQLEDMLRRRDFRPLVYHGKLSASERREQQQRFIESRDGIILATNAFGMGVDKPDIRFIIHYQVPRTLEAYYQEIGRAGRDGKGSLCELLYFEEDVAIQRNFTEWANPDFDFMMHVVEHLVGLGERVATVDLQTLRETLLIKNRHDGRIQTCLNLLETAGCTRGVLGHDFEWLRTPDGDEIREWLPEGKRERDLMGLLQTVRYAHTDGCRKAHIHRYFGTGGDESCGACDRDQPLPGWLEQALPADQRHRVPRPGTTEDSGEPAPLARGDWIDVRGRGLCHVVRVDRAGKRLRVDVEVARDLKSRSLDLRRVQWRRVEPDQ